MRPGRAGKRKTVEKVTIPALQRMKRDGRKIVGVVAWDYQIAQIVDRAGVDIVSVGDSVGVNLWGRAESASPASCLSRKVWRACGSVV